MVACDPSPPERVAGTTTGPERACLRVRLLNELKIDKSFVQRMSEEAGDAVIVKATIELGHNMGLKVVAEGVETATARATLEATGCDILRGYLISKPLPAAAFAEWVERVMPEALRELSAA
jgi:EAL domain-containing protein (putative c-di-GMP-specific phosphodiesterase class I)